MTQKFFNDTFWMAFAVQNSLHKIQRFLSLKIPFKMLAFLRPSFTSCRCIFDGGFLHVGLKVKVVC